MRSTRGFSLRRIFVAMTLSPLPFVLLHAEFRILAVVLSIFSVCMSLWGRPHHLNTFLRLFIPAVLGSMLLVSSAPSSSFMGRGKFVSIALIGAICGLILGYFWVEHYYDTRRLSEELSSESDRVLESEPRFRWAGLAVLLLFAYILFVFSFVT